MYLGLRKPFKTRSKNRLEIFNDWMIHVTAFHMIFFAGLETVGEFHETLGYSMIACILFMMSVSMIKIL